MSDRQRVFLLILIMSVISLSVAGIAIYVLYNASLEGQRARLMDTAQSRARLIEAMARHDAIYEQNTPGGPIAATLSQIVDAHGRFKGFGETGEFTLARREGDLIVFLLNQRYSELTYPAPVDFQSELAEAMRLALQQRSGSIIGLDYRGELVLAAYEPVAGMDWGIVAKIDMAEIRAPFVQAGYMAGGVAVAAVLLGSLLFIRISNPMIRHLRDYSEKLEEMVDKRTKELRDAQEKLFTSERLATLGQFSGSISHELRNPLGVIDSSVFYLKTTLKDADKKTLEHLDRIRSSVGSTTAIIDSLLGLTRMREPQ